MTGRRSAGVVPIRSPHSHSAYSSYWRCPPTYKLCYVEGDEGVTPPALRDGSLRHEFAARYGAHCFAKGRTCDMEEGRRLALGYPDDVRKSLENFIENWRFDWGTTIVEGVAPVEQEFRAKLPGGEVFSGHIDLLQKYEGAATVAEVPFGDDDGVVPEDEEEGDGALYVITDLKSSLYGDDWDEDNAPKQLKRYAWLVQNAIDEDGNRLFPGARAFRLILHSIRTGAQREWSLAGDLSYIGNELQAIADRIAAETEWETTPGEACLSCLHVHACPKRATMTVEVITEEAILPGVMPLVHLRNYYWFKAQAAAQLTLLKEEVALTEETVYLDGKAKYGPRMGASSTKVKDYRGLVELALTPEGEEALTTEKSRLPGVARLLKPDKDVAAALLSSPALREQAMDLIEFTPQKKETIGFIYSAGDAGEGD